VHRDRPSLGDSEAGSGDRDQNGSDPGNRRKYQSEGPEDLGDADELDEAWRVVAGQPMLATNFS